jgi:hypothetical protein
VNYAVAHSLHRHSESLVNAFERVALRVVQEIMKHQHSGADADKQAWLATYATGPSHDSMHSAPGLQTAEQINAIGISLAYDQRGERSAILSRIQVIMI